MPWQVFTNATYCNKNKRALMNKLKALIISRNKSVKTIARFIIGDLVSCQISQSAPEGKHLFKSAATTKILVLDWSLQDKYGSILKCLTEAKARKNVLIVNIFESDAQKKWAYQKLPNIKNNNKIYSIFSDFLSLSLTIVLFKIKMRLVEKIK